MSMIKNYIYRFISFLFEYPLALLTFLMFGLLIVVSMDAPTPKATAKLEYQVTTPNIANSSDTCPVLVEPVVQYQVDGKLTTMTTIEYAKQLAIENDHLKERNAELEKAKLNNNSVTDDIIRRSSQELDKCYQYRELDKQTNHKAMQLLEREYQLKQQEYQNIMMNQMRNECKGVS